jgi:oligopeptide transport system substrate-binding protein
MVGYQFAAQLRDPSVRAKEKLAVVVLGAALLAGCARRETPVSHGLRHQILHIGNGNEPQDLDPHVVSGVPEHHLLTALLEGLSSPDPKDLRPEPGAAERWDISADGTVYTFHLRKNGRWSNGDPVTAHDFVRSYRRILTPTLASEYAYLLHVLKNAEAFNTGKVTNFAEVGVKALDDFTLEITLHAPTPYFLSLLHHYTWFPVHLPTVERHGKPYERGSRWTRPGRYVGNGPFVLKEWRVNHIIVVEKNTNYWDAARVRLRQIHFHPIESSDTDERAFRAGQLHKSYVVPESKIALYRQRQPEVLRVDPYLATYFYSVNVTRPPLNDTRVRRALALAIDREAIVTTITRGGQQPAYCFTPPNTAGYTCRTQLQPDVAAARRLLAEAGYPDGRGLPPIEILFNTLETHRTIAEAIQQMWKKNLNVDARLQNQEWKVFRASLNQKNYQVARDGWTGDYPDPNTFLETFLSGAGNNNTGWANAAYDRLVREAGRAGDPARRFELFQQAEAILLDEVPIIPLYFYTRPYLLHPAVRGWWPNLLDEHPYKYVWLEAGAAP